MSDPENFTDCGMWEGVPYETYDKWPGLRHTYLWTLFRRTPAHYRYDSLHQDEKRYPQRELGTAVHTAILEPERFESDYIVMPETYTADRGKDKGTEKPWHFSATVCKEWMKDAHRKGSTVLKREERAAACGMRDSVRANLTFQRAIQGAKTEISIQWRDPETGLLLKARPDIIRPKSMMDLKSTRDASARPFGWQAYFSGWHFQGVMYMQGIAAVWQPVDEFILMAVENYPPYCTKAYPLGEDALFIGKDQLKGTLDLAARCLKHDHWPGYNDDTPDLVLPPSAGQELPDAQPPIMDSQVEPATSMLGFLQEGDGQ